MSQDIKESGGITGHLLNIAHRYQRPRTKKKQAKYAKPNRGPHEPYMPSMRLGSNILSMETALCQICNEDCRASRYKAKDKTNHRVAKRCDIYNTNNFFNSSNCASRCAAVEQYQVFESLNRNRDHRLVGFDLMLLCEVITHSAPFYFLES
jgi:hypothetical protein